MIFRIPLPPVINNTISLLVSYNIKISGQLVALVTKLSVGLGHHTYPYIFPKELSTIPEFTTLRTLATNTSNAENLIIAYISVSKPTPWTVAGPQGQLASLILLNHLQHNQHIKTCKQFFIYTQRNSLG